MAESEKARERGEEDEANEERGEQPGTGRWRRWRWWLLGVVLLFLLVPVVVALMMMRQGAVEAVDETAAAAPERPASALYYPLRPPFVVNFEHRGRVRYLQVSITLMARDPAVIEAVQQHMPLIRNRVILLLGGEDFEELRTDEGRELLRLALLEALQEILEEELGKPGIEQVLFTNFVMQ